MCKLFLSCFILSGTVLAFYMNYYKINIFDYYISHNIDGYPIFPWQKTDFISSQSTAEWLKYHVVISLTHICITLLRTLNILYFKLFTNLFEMIFTVSHLIFAYVISQNIEHFGNLPPRYAAIANGIPFLIANITFISHNKLMLLIYFIAISSPVWFETGLWLFNLKTVIQLIIFRFSLVYLK